MAASSCHESSEDEEEDQHDAVTRLLDGGFASDVVVKEFSSVKRPLLVDNFQLHVWRRAGLPVHTLGEIADKPAEFHAEGEEAFNILVRQSIVNKLVDIIDSSHQASVVRTRRLSRISVTGNSMIAKLQRMMRAQQCENQGFIYTLRTQPPRPSNTPCRAFPELVAIFRSAVNNLLDWHTDKVCLEAEVQDRLMTMRKESLAKNDSDDATAKKLCDKERRARAFWKLFHAEDGKLQAAVGDRHTAFQCKSIAPHMKAASRVSDDLVSSKTRFFSVARVEEGQPAGYPPDRTIRAASELKALATRAGSTSPSQARGRQALRRPMRMLSDSKLLLPGRTPVAPPRDLRSNLRDETNSVLLPPVQPMLKDAWHASSTKFWRRRGDRSSDRLVLPSIGASMRSGSQSPSDGSCLSPSLSPTGSPSQRLRRLTNMHSLLGCSDDPIDEAQTHENAKHPSNSKQAMCMSSLGMQGWHSTVRAKAAQGATEMSEPDDSAMRRYVRLCHAVGVVPTPHVYDMIKDGSVKGLGGNMRDDDLRAVVVVLKQFDCIDSVDLSGSGMLTDESLVPLLEKLRGKPAADTLRRLSLRDCKGMCKASMDCVVSLLGADAYISRLTHLDLSGIQLAPSTCLPLCTVIGEHPIIQVVAMADTGLATRQTARQCAEALLTGPSLRTLDLSWNAFTEDVLLLIGRLACDHRDLSSLSLSNCAGAGGSSGYRPMADFAEGLRTDRTLTFLDVSLNRIDSRNALVFEDALQYNTKMESICLAQNPLGVQGLRSFLRLLTSDQNGLVQFDCAGCTSRSDELVFNPVNPSGNYELDLSLALDRAILRMLCKFCDRLGASWEAALLNVAYVQTTPASKKGPARRKTSKKIELSKDAQGAWHAPHEGILTFTFSLLDAVTSLFLPAEADLRAAEPLSSLFLQKYLSRARLRPCFKKVSPLLTLWRTLDPAAPEVPLLLEAFARDFTFTSQHIEQLCRGPAAPVEVLSRLLPVLNGGPMDRFLVVSQLPSLRLYKKLYDNCYKLLELNVENPTGQYVLDLGTPSEYGIAEVILLIDRWESALARKEGRKDSSQYACWSNIRSCYHGSTVITNLPEFRLPTDNRLKFDYITWRRPPQNPSKWRVSNETWAQIILALAGDQEVTMPLRVKAVCAISDKIYVTMLQIRELLGLFSGNDHCDDLTAILLTRAVDPENSKVLRAKVTSCRGDWNQITQRLGIIASFPFFQPENFRPSLQLEVPEERLAASFFFQMALKERPGMPDQNIADPILKKADGTVFDFPMGIPRSWMINVKEMPAAGTLTLSYRSSAECRQFGLRQELARSYGGWQSDTTEAAVLWWSSLEENPQCIITLMQYLLPQFNYDIWAAFRKIDVNGSGKVTLAYLRRSVVENFKWRKFVKAPELVVEVFRFLDPDGGGDVSPEEWSVLADCAKEFQLCLLELLQFLERFYEGDFDKAWDSLDADGGGSIDAEEWADAMDAIGYYGPSQILFELLALDQGDERFIVKEGWEALRQMWLQREDLRSRLSQGM
eukprot:TRINITY_DN61865_c0_g1_i1.p1 TRINITY_DN61865_c0_g1~~TRINITY_DN61865_c0_g1_i1.p1  ORF type:complete len:1521 (-),score=283.51 TRINITY_DN61865_c0_g1_i1:202-4764(-)